MTRVTHISHTDDTFTSAVEPCHLLYRYQHSRRACYSVFKEENQVGQKIILLFHRMRQQVGPLHWYVAT